MKRFTDSEFYEKLHNEKEFNFEMFEWFFDRFTDLLVDTKETIKQQNATDEEKKLIKAITETTESILPKLWELNKTLYEHSLTLENKEIKK